MKNNNNNLKLFTHLLSLFLALSLLFSINTFAEQHITALPTSPVNESTITDEVTIVAGSSTPEIQKNTGKRCAG